MKDLYAAIVLAIPSIVLIVWAIKQERKRNHGPKHDPRRA